LSSGIFILDRDFKVVWINRATEEFFGIEKDTIIGCDKRKAIQEKIKHVFEDPEQFEQTVLRTYDDNTCVENFECHVLPLGDRKERFLLHWSAPIRTGAFAVGRIEHYYDVTERKRAEKALRESEERYRAIFEQAADSIVLIDAETGALVEFNDRAHENLGYTREEFKKLKIPNFEIIESDEKVAKRIEKIIKEGADTFETKHRTKSGEVRDILVSATAISVRGRDFVQSMWRDITARKRAEEDIRQRTAQLEALREGGLELTAQLDLGTLLHSIASRAAALLGGTLGTVYLYQPERDVLELSVTAGHNPPPTGIVLHRGEGLAGKVLETGEPLTVDDYQHWEGRATIYDDYSFTAIMGVPVRWGQAGAEEEFLGVLDVHADSPRTFSPADAELLSLFATQSATAIRNARLLQAEQEQRELAEALEEAAAAVSSTLDLDEVLDRILEQVERVVPGGVFNVMLIEDSVARAVRWRGYEHLGIEEQIVGLTVPIAEYPSLVRMVQTGEPVVVLDTATDPDWVMLEGQEWRRSYVAAPIRVNRLTVGFLNVDGTRPDQFGPAAARRLEAFASHAAAAIENAQLYRELQAHAGQLEQRVRERTTELQAQYAWLDAILGSTTDGIVATNEEGSIVQANPVAQAWLTQTLSPEEAGRLREAVQSVARQACAEETRLCPDAQPKWFSGKNPVSLLELTGLDLELSAALVVQEGAEKPTAAVVDIHDVSHLKALNRIKTRFVSNISHELRTPITTIKLYAHLMRQRPERWVKYLDVLAQEADRQARLVEDILQISRIDAGRIEMEPRPTPLNELTETVVASHHVLAQEQGLTLEHWPETGFFGKNPVSLVDPERMMQVLNNLVENAIYYTPVGGKVVVSTGMEETEGRTWATVTVADTGMGIPEEELPHLFERFFRGVEPRSMQISGTGLGLAIAKEIVELHGGRVTVESQVDVGSTFTVWLPLAD